MLKEIVLYFRINDSSWDGKEIVDMVKILEKVKSFVFCDVENYFVCGENYYYCYFKICEK